MATFQDAVDRLRARFPSGIPKNCTSYTQAYMDAIGIKQQFCAGGGEPDAMAILAQLGLAGGSYGWSSGGTSLEAMQLLKTVQPDWEPFSMDDKLRLEYGSNIVTGIAQVGDTIQGVISAEEAPKLPPQEIQNTVAVGTAAVNPSLPAPHLISSATTVPTTNMPVITAGGIGAPASTVTAVPTSAKPMNTATPTVVSKMDTTTQLKWVAAIVAVLILVEVLRR